MGFTEILTVLFIGFKLGGVIDWNWFFVLLPEIIALVGYLLFYSIVLIMAIKEAKKENKK